MLAAHGAGHYASISEGIGAMIRPGRQIEPISANVDRYAEIYPKYIALYPALKEALNA